MNANCKSNLLLLDIYLIDSLGITYNINKQNGLHRSIVFLQDSQKRASPISATGPSGAEFEVKVGASYLLSMLADAPARGMPGTTIEKISFQQGDDGYPMDDVVVATKNADGETGTLEIQAKRSITFAPKDSVFKKVMSLACLV